MIVKLLNVFQTLFLSGRNKLTIKGSSGTIYFVELLNYPKKGSFIGDFSLNRLVDVEGDRVYFSDGSYYEFEFDLFYLNIMDTETLKIEYKNMQYHFMSHNCRNNKIFQLYGQDLEFKSDRFINVHEDEKFKVVKTDISAEDREKYPTLSDVVTTIFLFLDKKETGIKSIMRVGYDLSTGEVSEQIQRLELAYGI